MRLSTLIEEALLRRAEVTLPRGSPETRFESYFSRLEADGLHGWAAVQKIQPEGTTSTTLLVLPEPPGIFHQSVVWASKTAFRHTLNLDQHAAWISSRVSRVLRARAAKASTPPGTSPVIDGGTCRAARISHYAPDDPDGQDLNPRLYIWGTATVTL